MKSKFKKVMLGFLVVIVLIGSVFYLGLKSKLDEFSKEVSKIEVNNIDSSKLTDGEYTGKYYFNEFVGATVKVTIENNKITDIQMLDHKNGKGKKAEEILSSVINAQSLEVDTITGATGSSIMILKAIEDALN